MGANGEFFARRAVISPGAARHASSKNGPAAVIKRIKQGRLYLIPASPETRGHLTTGNAAFYKQELLQSAPQRTM
jgi:hypothetical protein